ncbi:unnamed protein product [Medioppia subpectinata]|uniref:Prominin-like protein n=1 Tax=Medioppia subpectinata TaxID=1979941 RepID=A0A7R9KBS1_9ACAR|nr:unnamed protein product [Medioppia subpectinata]CAG2100544.1 unnamed protein product [Medioppia subpectinata]
MSRSGAQSLFIVPLVVVFVLNLKSLPTLCNHIQPIHTNEQNMDQMNDDIPWRQIKFISPQQSVSQSQWHSAIPVFSGKGMDHLYLLTQYVIDLLQSPGLPSSIIKDELFDDPIPVLQHNKGKLITHFWGLILTSIVILSVGIGIPLIGFICCCCCGPTDKRSRRAKHSRSYTSSSSSSPSTRRSGHKKKRYKVDGVCDPCVRSISAVKLFVLLLLMAFFVICAFVTNEYIRTGVKQMPKALNQSTDDLMLYLNNTQLEVNTLLRTNFDQLEHELSDSLDKSGLIVKNRIAILSEAAALDNLTDIVSKLGSVLEDLKTLSGETTELRLLTVQLQSRLSRIKEDLDKFLQQCRDRVCTELKFKYNRVMESFSVSTRIDDLPDLKGKEAFDEISFKIQATVNHTIPDIKKQIRAVGLDLGLVADDINQVLRRPFADLAKVKSNVYTGQTYIEKYEIYRWYACLAGASILSLILILYSFGLLCGVCNQQPTRHNYKWRSKSSSRFFCCGIVLVVLLFFPLLLSSITLFLVGSVSDKTVCYYLDNLSDPQSKQIVGIVQNRFERMHYTESLDVIQGVKPNLADVLTRCHQNLSLFNVLQLNRFNQIQIHSGKTVNNFNISEILQFKDRYRIEEKLRAFLNRVNVNPSNVVLLTSDGYQLLEGLKETSLGTLNFSSYANVIKHSISPIDLVSISTELEREANRLPKNDFDNIARLRNIAMDLKVPINLVVKIKETIETLTAGAEKIERKANYGNKGLKEALTRLLKQAEDAQKFISSKGHMEIHSVAKAFVEDMSALVDQYAQHVIEEIQTGIGRCEPVSRAYNSSVLALCKETVLPFVRFVKNGYCKSHNEGPAPSAPPNRADEDNWSPGSLPPHLYGSRPPPYNFVVN